MHPWTDAMVPPAAGGKVAGLLLCVLCWVGSACSCNQAPADAAVPAPQPRSPAPPRTQVTPVAASPASAAPARQVAPATALDIEALPAELQPEEEALLRSWYERLGGIRAAETFPDLIGRAAELQLGKPYSIRPEAEELKAPQLLLSSFQCGSLVRSSLAVARCVWGSRPTPACFQEEMEAFAHRGGRLNGHTSKFHYFEDWLADNVKRGRLSMLTAKLGGTAHQRVFSYLTDHPTKYPQLKLRGVLPDILAVQRRLSAAHHLLIAREQVGHAQAELRAGDVIGVATRKPGLLVTHTGLVLRGDDGVPRLLHASSFHKRVVLTKNGLKGYVLRRPERVGLMVARPTQPSGGPPRASD